MLKLELPFGPTTYTLSTFVNREGGYDPVTNLLERAWDPETSVRPSPNEICSVLDLEMDRFASNCYSPPGAKNSLKSPFSIPSVITAAPNGGPFLRLFRHEKTSSRRGLLEALRGPSLLSVSSATAIIHAKCKRHLDDATRRY
jgi:hypothetical protein